MASVNIKFLFANYEGVSAVVSTTSNTLVADIKRQLIASWPTSVPACDDISRIRLICMGSGILNDDSILGPKFPVFEHPTPVNVSIRPANAVASTGKGRTASSSSVGSAPTTAYTNNRNPAATGAPQERQNPASTSCCCNLS